jgi:hypothetical protein
MSYTTRIPVEGVDNAFVIHNSDFSGDVVVCWGNVTPDNGLNNPAHRVTLPGELLLQISACAAFEYFRAKTISFLEGLEPKFMIRSASRSDIRKKERDNIEEFVRNLGYSICADKIKALGEPFQALNDSSRSDAGLGNFDELPCSSDEKSP